MPQTKRLMTIGEAARATGVAATTLRYYERERILAPTVRNGAGYRLYDAQAVERLKFIRSAQDVGFTLDDIRSLLQIEGEAPCKEVRELLEHRLAAVETKLAELRRARATLADALERCRKSRKECAVLGELRKQDHAGRKVKGPRQP